MYALNKKVQTVCCSKINTYIEQRMACNVSAGNMPLTYLNENWPKKKWNLVSGDASELLSQGTLLKFHQYPQNHMILSKLVSVLPPKKCVSWHKQLLSQEGMGPSAPSPSGKVQGLQEMRLNSILLLKACARGDVFLSVFIWPWHGRPKCLLL